MTDGATGVHIEGARAVELATFGAVEISAEQVVMQRAPATRAVRQLPPLIRDFIGRGSELAGLVASFEKGVSISALRGMGGVGKTQLALAVAHRVESRFPDGQIFLDLRGASASPLRTSDVMTHVIRSLEPDAQLGGDEAQIAATYRSVLAGRRVLLVLDNAAELGQVEALVPAPPCVVLVTSRQRFALPGFVSVDLDVLDEGSAVSLLHEICPRTADVARELAQCCGYLPLALRLVGSLLETQPDLSPARLVSSLRVAAAEHEIAELDACFEASYAQLRADDRERWVALGIVPDDFSPEAIGGMWKCDTAGAELHLSRLTARSLVSFDPESKRYRLHDLLRDFARSKLSRERRDALELRFAQVMFELLQRREDEYQSAGEASRAAVRVYRADRGLWATAQKFVAELASKPGPARDACIAYDDAGRGLRSRHQDARERLAWAEAALSAFEASPWYRALWWSLRRRRAALLAARLRSVAASLDGVQRSREALEVYERIAALRGLGRTHRCEAILDVARLESNLGHPEAAGTFETALRLATTPTQRADALSGSANAFANRGDFAKARELAERALPDTRGYSQEAYLLLDLARYERALGQLEQARNYCEEALSCSKSDYSTHYALEELRAIAETRGDAGLAHRLLEARLDSARETSDARLEFEARVAVYRHDFQSRKATDPEFAAISEFARAQGLWEDYGHFLEFCVHELGRLGEMDGAAVLERQLGDLVERHVTELSPGQVASWLKRRAGEAPANGARLAEKVLDRAREEGKLSLQAVVEAHRAETAAAEGDWTSARSLGRLAWSAAMESGDVYVLRQALRTTSLRLQGTAREGVDREDSHRQGFVRDCAERWSELIRRTGDPRDAADALRGVHGALEPDDARRADLYASASRVSEWHSESRDHFELLRELRVATAPTVVGRSRVKAPLRFELALREHALARRLRDVWMHTRAISDLLDELPRNPIPGEHFGEMVHTLLHEDIGAARRENRYELLFELLQLKRRLDRHTCANVYTDEARLAADERDEAKLREMLAVPGIAVDKTDWLRFELSCSLSRQARHEEALVEARSVLATSTTSQVSFQALLAEVGSLRQLRRVDEAKARALVALEHARPLDKHCEYDALRVLVEIEIEQRDSAAARARLAALRELARSSELGRGRDVVRLEEHVAKLEVKASS